VLVTNCFSDEGLTRSIYSEPSTIAARILINVEIELKDFGKNAFIGDIQDAFNQAKSCVKINYIRNILNFALQLPDEVLAKYEGITI
jgi:hypothetical protein